MDGGGGDAQDVSVGWFLGRLHILEERMRSTEQEIAEMRQEHGFLRRCLSNRSARRGGTPEENFSLVDAESETCASSTESKDVDCTDAKWRISAELSELVAKTHTSQVLRTMSAPENIPRPMSNVLQHCNSAPPKLYSWEAIVEKDRIRAEEISKLNRKYRWFTKAAEGFMERMMKAKQHREASETSNCADNNNTKEKGWVSSATDGGGCHRLPEFSKAAMIQSTKSPPIKLLKEQDHKQEPLRSWHGSKIDNGNKVEDSRMRYLADRFRIHWNATFASTTLITENSQSIGASTPRNICSETSGQQQNQIHPFLSEKQKNFTTTAIQASANTQQHKRIFSQDFISMGSGDGTPFDDKVRATLEYTHILKTIRERDGCLKAD
ncbi:hypothetical protein BSKO_05914 [Bryopsis sp. KO-2023]|nr:hypothetical protein BSKO_05914 [Bryopsis sp. KO-2023]